MPCVVDGQVARQEGTLRSGALAFPEPALGRPHPGHQLSRREGLDDIVLGPQLKDASDHLIPSGHRQGNHRYLGNTQNTLDELVAFGFGQDHAKLAPVEIFLLRQEQLRPQSPSLRLLRGSPIVTSPTVRTERDG